MMRTHWFLHSSPLRQSCKPASKTTSVTLTRSSSLGAPISLSLRHWASLLRPWMISLCPYSSRRLQIMRSGTLSWKDKSTAPSSYIPTLYRSLESISRHSGCLTICRRARTPSQTWTNLSRPWTIQPSITTKSRSLRMEQMENLLASSLGCRRLYKVCHSIQRRYRFSIKDRGANITCRRASTSSRWRQTPKRWCTHVILSSTLRWLDS